MEKNKSKQNLLKKLLAVIEHQGGNENEKANAQRILYQLLEKYSVSLDDLNAVEEKWVEFKYVNKLEEKILAQILCKVLNRGEIECKRVKGEKRIYIKCTKSTAAEVGVLFNFYIKLWRDELNLFHRAFIQKHCLFSENAEGREIDDETLFRLIRMMSAMEDKTPLKQIEKTI